MRRINRLKDIRDARSFDVVLVNRDLLGGKVFYEKRLFCSNSRVIFDFDDVIFLGQKEAHIGWICRNAAWVTAGNAYLAQFASRFTDRITVLPTVLEVDRYRVKEHVHADEPPWVGWCGSDRSIRETLFPFAGMFAELQRRLGFEFVIITKPKPELPDSGLHWHYVEWSEDIETELAFHMDIGVMPLIPDEFQKGKCGCKILQYMAAGIPAVASPVGVNTHLINHGRGGFLAETAGDWYRALRRLMSDHSLRREFGSSGRTYVEREYALKVWLPLLLELLERVSGHV